MVAGHPTMPEFSFDPGQVGDIIAYLKRSSTKRLALRRIDLRVKRQFSRRMLLESPAFYPTQLQGSEQ